MNISTDNKFAYMGDATDLAKMWAHLAAHQPIADQRGYGKAWIEMCEQRTPKVAKDAAVAARNATYMAGAIVRKINAAARAAEAAYAACVEHQSAITSSRIVMEEVESVRRHLAIAAAA